MSLSGVDWSILVSGGQAAESPEEIEEIVNFFNSTIVSTARPTGWRKTYG